MTILSNSQQIAQIFALPGLEVEESTHGQNYEQVEFSFKDNMHCGHGSYEIVGDTLNFHVCHQIEGQDFDIEHSMDNGEECVVFGNLGAKAGTVCLKDGRVNEVIVEVHPAKERISWRFSNKNGLRLLTFDNQ